MEDDVIQVQVVQKFVNVLMDLLGHIVKYQFVSLMESIRQKTKEYVCVFFSNSYKSSPS